MADLPYIQATLETKIVGQDATGNNVNYVSADANGNMLVKDYASGSATGGVAATVSSLTGGVFNTTLPTLTTGQQSAIQLDSNGRILISSVPGADTVATGALGALNAAVQVATAGQSTISMQLAAGTLIGTIVPEWSSDNGVTWNPTYFSDAGTGTLSGNIIFGSANTAIAKVIIGVPGSGLTRVRVSAYTSGTANVTVRASNIESTISLFEGIPNLPPPPTIVQVGALVGTSSPSYSNGNLNPLSLTLAGALRVDGSAVTQPVNLTQISGTTLTIGQQLMAASLPVVLSSNQSGINTFLDKNQTGTVGALNANVAIATNGMSSVIVTVTGTWSATLTFQGFDGTNWIVTAGLTQPAGGITESIVSNGTVLINSGGYSQIRIIAAAYTSGTANIFMNAGAGISLIEVYNDSQNPLIVAGQGTAGSPGTSALTIQGISGGTNVAVSQATASNLNAQVVGDVASAAADSGNPVKIGSVANTNIASLPTVTDGQRVNAQADLQGRIYVTNAPTDGAKPTYSASVTVTAAAAATDVVTITGSATTTVRITLVRISGIATTAITTPVLLIKRSAANTGGTSAALTRVPHDSNSAAATATGLSYTVNPTGLGAAVGTARQDRLSFAVTGSVAQDPIEWDFGNRPAQAIVLRGIAQVLAVNLNGVTVTGGSISVDIEWTEE